jgi:hypothetical protein
LPHSDLRISWLSLDESTFTLTRSKRGIRYKSGPVCPNDRAKMGCATKPQARALYIIMTCPLLRLFLLNGTTASNRPSIAIESHFSDERHPKPLSHPRRGFLQRAVSRQEINTGDATRKRPRPVDLRAFYRAVIQRHFGRD